MMTRRWELALLLAVVGQISAAPAQRIISQRIISMSPNATEILYGLGVIDRVVAVSDYDVWPPEVKKLPRIGGWSTPSLERVLAFRPDLVLLSDAQMQLIGPQLRQLGLNVVALPTHTLDDAYSAIRITGHATGREAEAAQMEASTRAGIERVRGRTRSLVHPSVLCVVDRTPGTLRDVYAAGDGSFIAELIAVAGAHSVVPRSNEGYSRVGKEALLAYNPDIIVDMMQGPPGRLGEDPQAVWRDFPELAAVRNHRIVPVHEDYVLHASQMVVKTAVLFARIFHPESPAPDWEKP
jgi:iron complex transport system substrate-binding protein